MVKFRILRTFQDFMLNFSMNQLSIFILILQYFIFSHVKAQIPSHEEHASSNFPLSLAAVLGFLSIMSFVTFILLYAKFCHQNSSDQNMNQQIQDGLVRSRSHVSGIDKTVIESLPFFRFSSLKGWRDGLECVVCLSKFEDIEILRLLPKCKHAFHIDCVDQWLENHSTCPLCRQKVSSDDLSQLTYSNSLRFLCNINDQLEFREESNIELYVEREENFHGSSRFNIGSSFRKLSDKSKKLEEEFPIRESCDESDETSKKLFQKFNHKITVSNVMLKNRWSNVSSSDLMFLNSEMLNDISSRRFSSLDSRNEQSHCSFPFQYIPTTSDESEQNSGIRSNILNFDRRGSMSEITVHPRFKNRDSSCVQENNVEEEERMRRIWLPIARKTVQWFAKRAPQYPQLTTSRERLNV